MIARLRELLGSPLDEEKIHADRESRVSSFEVGWVLKYSRVMDDVGLNVQQCKVASTPKHDRHFIASHSPPGSDGRRVTVASEITHAPWWTPKAMGFHRVWVLREFQEY
jgi:hypothetical protein